MAAPRDNMDEEMMDIINPGTQFADGNQQDTWLLKITKKILCKKILARYIYLYIYIFEHLSSIMCTHDIYLFFFYT